MGSMPSFEEQVRALDLILNRLPALPTLPVQDLRAAKELYSAGRQLEQQSRRMAMSNYDAAANLAATYYFECQRLGVAVHTWPQALNRLNGEPLFATRRYE